MIILTLKSVIIVIRPNVILPEGLIPYNILQAKAFPMTISLDGSGVSDTKKVGNGHSKFSWLSRQNRPSDANRKNLGTKWLEMFI